MFPQLEGLLWGLGAALTAAVALYLLWLRPGYLAARREREDAEALHRRLEHEAELKAEATLLEAKGEAIRIRERAEEEIRQKEAALDRAEERLDVREEGLEARRVGLEEREGCLARDVRTLAEREAEIEEKWRAAAEELERVSKLTRDKARDLYLSRLEPEFREAALRKAREVEAETVGEAERRARKAVLDVLGRSVTDYVTEATLAVVELPSEDMKGRIIGREGRNIRSFEQITGADLIIDETPEAVVISCFDPVRREAARLTLTWLMADGRIHPGRIEELHEKAQAEVARMVHEAGERAAERAHVLHLPPKVVEAMGRLRFRTSYAQNVLDHSVEVARLSAMLAAELGLNEEVARRAGFLHDIGKGLGPEWEGPHALAGMEFLRACGEREPVLNAVGAHHHEIEPATDEAHLVIVADSLSAARPGARRENLEHYLKRLSSLESLANSFPGVERSYAVQAGREVRLIVRPHEVDDLGAMRLANDVAKRIEGELQYPGQIKVTVIRETRAQGVAK